MARAADGTLVDPFGGEADLRARVLRHVSAAFAEDPLRVLRVARFAARLDFAVAPETEALLRAIVDSGELATLVPERVWQEIARALMEARPSRFFTLLRRCGALARILPEVDALFGVPQPVAYHREVDAGVHVLQALDFAAAAGAALPVRYAVLAHDLGKGATPRGKWPRHVGHEARGVVLADALAERLRVPVECRELARLAARYHGVVQRAFELRPATLLDLLLATDALRRPERIDALLRVCTADVQSRPGQAAAAFAPRERLEAALAVVRTVDAGKIAAGVSATTDLPARIRAARLRALREWLRRVGPPAA
jgi:tRNA nucleotidyltransferase (CCA-adding enzyme)